MVGGGHGQVCVLLQLSLKQLKVIANGSSLKYTQVLKMTAADVLPLPSVFTEYVFPLSSTTYILGVFFKTISSVSDLNLETCPEIATFGTPNKTYFLNSKQNNCIDITRGQTCHPVALELSQISFNIPLA